MKTTSFLLLFSIFTLKITAQNFYIQPHVGYATGAAKQSVSILEYYNQESAGTTVKRDQIYLSLGKGINTGITFGYNFNSNVAVNMGISYFLGSKIEARQISFTGSSSLSISARMLRLNPSVSISTDFEKFDVYAKMGMIMGSGKITFNSDYVSLSPNLNQSSTTILNGGLAFGISSGIGAIYSLSEKLSLFGELEMINMAYSPAKGEQTKSIFNGVDQLPTQTVNETEIEFFDNYTETDGSDLDAVPQKAPKFKLPLGSIGLNVGLRINF
jgi:hypothetical protein